MAYTGGILDQTHEQLFKQTGGQVRFSDVFRELVVEDEQYWWRKTDFDTELTDAVESSGFPEVEEIPIGFRPWFANYGLVLTDDLLRARNDRQQVLQALKEQAKEKTRVHPDILKQLDDSSRAIIALANYAPRDDKNTANHHNGSDFYLAITDAGLEIYTTPLGFLSNLDARHRITSLYQIPNEGHPEFDGDHEQYRSARVVRTRRHPDHLIPVFQYQDREALIQAKQDGNYPQIIPADERKGHIAFIDKFGNIKLELGDARAVPAVQLGKLATLVVRNAGNEYELKVQTVEDLRSSPLGKLAVYANCSDCQDEGSTTGFVELVSRVNGNPSTAKDTAIFQLLEKIPNLDPEKDEVELIL